MRKMVTQQTRLKQTETRRRHRLKQSFGLVCQKRLSGEWESWKQTMLEQTEENQIRKKSGLGSFFFFLLLPLQIFLFTFFVSFKITKRPSSFACHIRFSSTLPCPTTPLSPAVSSSLPVSTALTTSLPPIPSPPAVPLSLSTQAVSIDQTVSYRHCQYLSPLVWTQKETSGNFRFSFFYFPSYSSSKTTVGMMCRMKPRAAVEGDSSMQMTDSEGCLALCRRCWRRIDEQKLRVRASPVLNDLLSAREERFIWTHSANDVQE